ncbi:MAG: sugar phosphate isomerase/epimerase [Clostridium sp.]|nr:sugar phosphate isomerase/epimerase [Clostridium sp.]
MMKIGMSTNNFSSEPISDIIRTAKSFDIWNFELWAVNLDKTGEPDNPYTYKNRDVDKAYEEITGAGLHVGVVASGIGLQEEFTADRKQFSEELVHAVEIAHRFGAGVVLHYGVGFFRNSLPDIEKLKLYWQDAIDAAEQYGIKLALENEPIDYTWTPDNMKWLIDQFDSEAFKTNYDATNYFHSSAEAFPYGLMRLKDDIAYVHIKNGMVYEPDYCHEDCWKGNAMTHKYEGKTIYYTEADMGVINNTGLLRMLNSIGYQGICTPEPQHTTHDNACRMLEHDIGFLRSTGYFE